MDPTELRRLLAKEQNLRDAWTPIPKELADALPGLLDALAAAEKAREDAMADSEALCAELAAVEKALAEERRTVVTALDHLAKFEADEFWRLAGERVRSTGETMHVGYAGNFRSILAPLRALALPPSIAAPVGEKRGQACPSCGLFVGHLAGCARKGPCGTTYVQPASEAATCGACPAAGEPTCSDVECVRRDLAKVKAERDEAKAAARTNIDAHKKFIADLAEAIGFPEGFADFESEADALLAVRQREAEKVAERDALRAHLSDAEIAQGRVEGERNGALAREARAREALMALLSLGMPGKYAELTKHHPERRAPTEVAIVSLIDAALSSPAPSGWVVLNPEDAAVVTEGIKCTPTCHGRCECGAIKALAIMQRKAALLSPGVTK